MSTKRAPDEKIDDFVQKRLKQGQQSRRLASMMVGVPARVRMTTSGANMIVSPGGSIEIVTPSEGASSADLGVSQVIPIKQTSHMKWFQMEGERLVVNYSEEPKPIPGRDASVHTTYTCFQTNPVLVEGTIAATKNEGSIYFEASEADGMSHPVVLKSTTNLNDKKSTGSLTIELCKDEIVDDTLPAHPQRDVSTKNPFHGVLPEKMVTITPGKSEQKAGEEELEFRDRFLNGYVIKYCNNVHLSNMTIACDGKITFTVTHANEAARVDEVMYAMTNGCLGFRLTCHETEGTFWVIPPRENKETNVCWTIEANVITVACK